MSAPARRQAEETPPLGQAAEDEIAPTWSTKVGWGHFPPYRGLGPTLQKKTPASGRAVQTISLLAAAEPPLTRCLLR